MDYEIPVSELKRRIDAGEPVRLIDVRQPEEHAIARLEGSDLIPMGDIPAHLQALEAFGDDSALVIYCHHGIRSLQVVHWLRQHGVEALSMAGGIDGWSLSIDPSVPRY